MRPILHLIGVNHDTPEFGRLRYNLVRQASRREIVLGMEDVIRDNTIEEKTANELHGVKQGFIHGYEGHVELTYCQLLGGHYHHATEDSSAPDGARMLAGVKSNLIWHVYVNPIMRNVFQTCAHSTLPLREKLVASHIEAFVANHQTFKDWDLTQGQINKMVEQNDPGLVDHEAWMDLYARMLREMRADIRGDYRHMVPTLGIVENYLEDPHQEGALGRLRLFISEWRNAKIATNAIDISDLAVRQGLDFYMPIGFLHVEGLQRPLQKGIKDMEIVVSRSDQGVPDEYTSLTVVPEDVKVSLDADIARSEALH